MDTLRRLARVLLIVAGAAILLSSAGCGLIAGKAVSTGLGSVKDVEVTPEQIALLIGQQQLFTAHASKVLGNDKEAEADWEVNGGVGFVDENGLFTATNPGEGEVKATVKTTTGLVRVTGKARVFVSPPTVATPRILSASVSPETASAGSAITLTAKVDGAGSLANIQQVEAKDLATGYTVPMADDGLHYGDAAANDGLFTGRFVIPPGVRVEALRFGIRAEDYSSPPNQSVWEWVVVPIG